MGGGASAQQLKMLHPNPEINHQMAFAAMMRTHGGGGGPGGMLPGSSFNLDPWDGAHPLHEQLTTAARSYDGGYNVIGSGNPNERQQQQQQHMVWENGSNADSKAESLGQDQQAWLTRAMGTRFSPQESVNSNGSTFHPLMHQGQNGPQRHPSRQVGAKEKKGSRRNEPGTAVDRPYLEEEVYVSASAAIAAGNEQPIYGMASEGGAEQTKPRGKGKGKGKKPKKGVPKQKKGSRASFAAGAAPNGSHQPKLAHATTSERLNIQKTQTMTAAMKATLVDDAEANAHFLSSDDFWPRTDGAATEAEAAAVLASGGEPDIIEVGVFDYESNTDQSESLYAEDFMMLKRGGKP